MPSLAGLFFWMNIKLENIKKLDVTKPLKLDCRENYKRFSSRLRDLWKIE